MTLVKALKKAIIL